MKHRLELMDWKEIERQAEMQLRQAKIMLVNGELMYNEAIKNIKKLGGLTNKEEDAEAGKKHNYTTTKAT